MLFDIDGSPHCKGDPECSGCYTGPQECKCGGLIHEQTVFGPSFIYVCDVCSGDNAGAVERSDRSDADKVADAMEAAGFTTNPYLARSSRSNPSNEPRWSIFYNHEYCNYYAAHDDHKPGLGVVLFRSGVKQGDVLRLVDELMDAARRGRSAAGLVEAYLLGRAAANEAKWEAITAALCGIQIAVSATALDAVHRALEDMVGDDGVFRFRPHNHSSIADLDYETKWGELVTLVNSERPPKLIVIGKLDNCGPRALSWTWMVVDEGGQ